jgi:purine nucleosidase
MKRQIIIVLVAAIAFGFNAVHGPSSMADDNAGKSCPVVFIHGGAIDDFVSYLLLTTMEGAELRGVIVTNTDCVARYAMQAQWKIQRFIKDEDVPIGLSNARGWNAFPWIYRSDSIRQHDIEALAGHKDNQAWPPFPSGDVLLRGILSKAVEKDTPVTILITCPVTTVSNLLKEHPKLEKGIGRLIWMGGAIRVKGNLDKNTIPAEVANPEAEWNVFWDPQGADWLFRNTSFPIVLFPLDVTDQAPLTKAFEKTLGSQSSSFRYSRLVSEGYALTHTEPFYEMWNTVTTAYLAHPEFFDKPKTMRLKVETAGYIQGAIRQSPQGRPVLVVFSIAEREQFYDYVLRQFRRDYSSK